MITINSSTRVNARFLTSDPRWGIPWKETRVPSIRSRFFSVASLHCRALPRTELVEDCYRNRQRTFPNEFNEAAVIDFASLSANTTGMDPSFFPIRPYRA